MEKKIRIVTYPIPEKYCPTERGKEYKHTGKDFYVTTYVHRIEHQDYDGEWRVLIKKMEPLLKNIGIFYGGYEKQSFEEIGPDTFVDFEGSLLIGVPLHGVKYYGLADIILRDEQTLDFVLLGIDSKGHKESFSYESYERTGKQTKVKSGRWKGYSVPEKKQVTRIKTYYYKTFCFDLRSLDLDTLKVSDVGTSTVCKYSNCKIHKRDIKVDSLVGLSDTKVLCDLDKHFCRGKTREYTVSYSCFENIKELLFLG